MIINKESKRYQTRSDKPNCFWLEESEKEKYYVIDDNSELAKKIRENYPYIDFILNEENNLIDIDITIQKEQRNNIRNFRVKIQDLKKQLSATDYQAIKYAEGQLSEEEYAEMKTQRQSWRDEINNLEKQIEELKS